MKKTIWWLILVFALGLVAAIVYHAFQKTREEPVSPPVVAPPAAVPSEPQTRYPLPQESQEPLPALSESDSAIQEALRGLWSGNTLERLFQLDGFIRRVVVTIDNLPRKKLPVRLLPVRQAPGKFRTTGKDQSLAISRDNAARYGAYVRMADTVDVSKLAALYVRFYPLFQQAYQDLGYPKGYFNDRLIVVIDDLLAAPEVQAPVNLVRPNVFYVFADPELEARSAGQKILMRIGNENAAKIKAKLREIRDELIHRIPKQ